jgi:hypothetical protein
MALRSRNALRASWAVKAGSLAFSVRRYVTALAVERRGPQRIAAARGDRNEAAHLVEQRKALR